MTQIPTPLFRALAGLVERVEFSNVLRQGAAPGLPDMVDMADVQVLEPRFARVLAEMNARDVWPEVVKVGSHYHLLVRVDDLLK